MRTRSWAAVFAFIALALSVELTEAHFASRFSLSAGEEYNDNVFFTQKKSHDFVTVITPALHFLIRPIEIYS